MLITCVVEYVIDPAKIEAFEAFAGSWMELVDRHGGHFLPFEGASEASTLRLSRAVVAGSRPRCPRSG